MLYLNYAKPIQGGNILNFFADSEKDLEAVSGGKRFIANNGTDYGVPIDSSTVIITLPDKTKKTYVLSGGEWIESPGIESFIDTELNPMMMSVPLLDAIQNLALQFDAFKVEAKYDEETGFVVGSEYIELQELTSFNKEKSKPMPGELYLVYLPDINDFGSIMREPINNGYDDICETPTTYICKVVEGKDELGNQLYFLINYDCTLETFEDYSKLYEYMTKIDTSGFHGVYDERYSSVKFVYPYDINGGMRFILGGFMTREKRLKSMTFSMIRIK